MYKIKHILIVALMAFNLNAQNDLVVMSSTKHHVVYRDVPNLIQVAFANMNSPYYIECIGGQITNLDTLGNTLPRNNFIVTPGKPWKIFIRLYDNNDSLNRTLISEYEFVNRDLPDPSLFYGAASPGQSVYWQETKLFVKYPPLILLDYRFKIISWHAKVGKKELQGKGNVLSSDFCNAVKKLKSDKEFSISVIVLGEDNKERTITSTFKRAPDAWYKDPPEFD